MSTTKRLKALAMVANTIKPPAGVKWVRDKNKARLSDNESMYWADLLNTAQTNESLRLAVEQCTLIYNLSRNHTDGV